MRKVAVITNSASDISVANHVKAALGEGYECKLLNLSEAEGCSADFAVVIGGDGTMLSAGRALLENEIPIFGVNTGHLGYLTATEPEDLEESLALLSAGNYTVEERVVLSVNLKDKVHYCINEAVFHRGNEPHLLKTGIKLNGRDIDVIRGDGILIATPTGSTAYNLSAGGPVLVPTAKNMVLTPICAHSLTARPVVLADDDVVTATVFGEGSDARLSIDGKISEVLSSGEAAEVKISDKKLRLIKVGEHNFYKILRSKLTGK